MSDNQSVGNIPPDLPNPIGASRGEATGNQMLQQSEPSGSRAMLSEIHDSNDHDEFPIAASYLSAPTAADEQALLGGASGATNNQGSETRDGGETSHSEHPILPAVEVETDLDWFEVASNADADEVLAETSSTHITTLYRLLKLLYEPGSGGQGGLVDKIVIDQKALESLLNRLSPNSYQSISSIDFKSLDRLAVKPQGVYGSRPEIAKFLFEAGIITEANAQSLSQPEETSNGPSLRSGLYLALPPNQGEQENSPVKIYLVYWPEEATWRDDANSTVQRNRVTFMRYLTQLSDQIIALVSKEQAEAFVWESSAHPELASQDDEEDDDDDDTRMFTFKVQKSEDQEENVTVKPGFTVDPSSRLTSEKQVQLIGGETMAGLLLSWSEEPKQLAVRFNEEYTNMRLAAALTNNRHTQVVLEPGLTQDQLIILMNHGLRDKYKDIFDRFDDRFREVRAARDQQIEASNRAIQTEIQEQQAEIEGCLRLVARRKSQEFSVYAKTESKSKPEYYSQLLQTGRYPFISEIAQGLEKRSKMANIRDEKFQDLKTRISVIDHLLSLGSRKTDLEEEQQAVIQYVMDESIDTLRSGNSSDKGSSLIKKILGVVLGTPGSKDKDPHAGSPYQWVPPRLSDLEFLSGLDHLVEVHPILAELRHNVIECLSEYLSSQEDTFVSKNLEKAMLNTQRSREEDARVRAESIFKQSHQQIWETLWSNVRQAMQPDSSHETVLRIGAILTSRYAYNRASTTVYYRVTGTRTSVAPRRVRYAFHPLELTRNDVEQCQNDGEYIPKPIIKNTPGFVFKLEEGSSIEFIQPIRERCLVIVASHSESRIFMNRCSDIGQAISRRGAKTVLHHDRLRGKPIYAYDEVTRSLAICYGEEELMISWFVFDDGFLSLRNRGVISLQRWYEASVNMVAMCFVAGSTELCLVDSSGCARVLSLISEQFGPAYLQIGGRIRNACSAPDGSCLFLQVEDHRSSRVELRAFHWTSFGPECEGFTPTLVDPRLRSLIMSFERRGPAYLVSMDSANFYKLTSTALHVKQKYAKFDFKSKENRSKAAGRSTLNNCLVDSHMEVWTRFPVLPAVPRNTLLRGVREPRSFTFVSDGDFERVKDYFAKLVSTFERTTQKPTDGKLFSIVVRSSPESSSITSRRIETSCFHLGSFVVELLCLIPIQLAVTRENSFIPLKDGVVNPAFERHLLGAEVPNIINALSIGWYESLFQSYMATQPIRVVSSMGEQSVGKSYCLNHFADTTFAGSAMRTTEGVWLSCTPTNDYLLVCLDFEGVQSIERSAQEDTLLVLFNAAISNMVLFRNNFAISRNIAGLFKSFQSSAMVLDPQLNPGLFNSDLAIIIKDVIGSDSKDIVREFSQKFQGIVAEEQDQNFITRLHRGNLHIIPWPVIKSRKFYTLFQRIKETLEAQPFTHGGGGVFLHTLKTLMAKIKANDWAALDQNLAAHRAQQLSEWLPDVISRGGMEQSQGVWGPMKVIDTDEEVPQDSPVSNDVFWVPRDRKDPNENSEYAMEEVLAELVRKHNQHQNIRRHAAPEEIYIAGIQERLHIEFDQRIEHVRNWLSVNVQRFPQENQDIRDLFKTLETLKLTARATLQICASKCSKCHLLCLRPHRHVGQDSHDCRTDHSCIFSCEVPEEHSDSARCGLPSGHEGRHLCQAGKHTCGEVCPLRGRSGCEITCVKEIEHAGDHLCSARTHYCGEPCDLRNVNQYLGGPYSYSCPGLCQIPWDQEHDRHICANSQSCPMECRLCPRLCCDTDHFHALELESVHLCGQGHSCTMLCQAPGICQIETQPSAIIEQFTGRYEVFHYTRYSQEKRRLTCAVPIAPGQITHQGPHTHSTTGAVFHFCDVQCPRCKYYCTLPLGHPQQLHETSHGSMTETQWLIEGPAASASYELQDHMYGSGDQGSTVLCSLVCTQQGRHVHVDYCRSDSPRECSGEEYEHINQRILPHPDQPKDWISHRLYWARSGFKDPYARNEQIEFAKCDSFCPAPEHTSTPENPVNPSYCKLPILHAPVPSNAPPATGYISQDGHAFNCQSPAQNHQDYHIVFVIDSSSSMTLTDRQPLPNTPISERLRSECNNRYGAVLSALYAFWASREPRSNAARLSGSSRPQRTDAYSVITFSHSATERVTHSFSRTTGQLIGTLLPQRRSTGTNFTAAIEKARAVIQQNWSSQRAPVIIFLSDGAGTVEDETIVDVCTLCAQLGIPLSFFTISFGCERGIHSLLRMAQVARQVFQAARRNRRSDNANIPCSYVNALGSIDLASRFLDIANSLQKPRASLIGSSNNRLQQSTR